ncbi:DUF3017 domain-containing protein [Schaalia sp. 19OD2882]|uniref:DUF3017 domain-containing protein n=1 Tax=Schaalia sp. 19OD2882 TaxID=2794089 RepID=UPI0020A79D0A|nr:DUF3017 domain-containing protein [Schaalia sp. 19OD2882]
MTLPVTATTVGRVKKGVTRRRLGVWLTTGSVVFVALGVFTVAVLTLTNHPHRAVLLLSALLGVMGVLRAVWPSRPWFASRHRVGDVALYLSLAAGILVFSPWTAAMGQG